MDKYLHNKKAQNTHQSQNRKPLIKTGVHYPQKTPQQKLKEAVYNYDQMLAIFNPPKEIKVSPEKRTKLILEANKLYNEGQIEKARVIFAAINYYEGLTRIARDYYKAGKILESFATFHHAGVKQDTEELAKRIAASISESLKKDNLDQPD